MERAICGSVNLLDLKLITFYQNLNEIDFFKVILMEEQDQALVNLDEKWLKLAQNNPNISLSVP
jgi:hypothetical protein